LEVRRAGFGDDLAVAVGVEAIDRDAVEPADAAQFGDGGGEQVSFAGGAFAGADGRRRLQSGLPVAVAAPRFHPEVEFAVQSMRGGNQSRQAVGARPQLDYVAGQ